MSYFVYIRSTDLKLSILSPPIRQLLTMNSIFRTFSFYTDHWKLWPGCHIWRAIRMACCQWCSGMRHFSPLDSSRAQWLISDLIPKKSEKIEFRKNFMSIFFSVKNWPKKWNFDFYCLRNFRKIAKWSSKFRSGIFTWRMENFEKTHFASESA